MYSGGLLYPAFLLQYIKGKEHLMWANIFDLVVVLSLAGYVVSGFFSGFILQFARLFSIIGAFWAMRSWTPLLAPRLEFVAEPAWRSIAAGVIIFVAVMLVIGVAARLLKKLVAFSFGGWLDKLLGAVLSFAIGLIFWTVIIIVLEKFFPDSEFMRSSRVVPYFNGLVEYLRQWLPPDIAAYL